MRISRRRNPPDAVLIASTSSFSTRLSWILLACAAWAFGCGSESPSESEPVAPETEAPPSIAVEPSEEDEPADASPPEFDGLERISWVAEGVLSASWQPARDDEAISGEIRYEIYQQSIPFLELGSDSEPLVVTEPGVTSVEFEPGSGEGLFFARAIDPSGNRSDSGPGLAQRSDRPLVDAFTGMRVAMLESCVAFEPARAICVGADGFATRWDRDHWTVLESGVSAALRLHRGQGGTFVYSELGHLFEFAANEPLNPLDVTFEGPQPTPPFRQFFTDTFELRYWIDAEGRTYVGSENTFFFMERPLATPDAEQCPRLQGAGFTGAAAFVVCEDGSVLSANVRDAGLRWQPVTVNTPFRFERGLERVFTRSDARATVMDASGIRRVETGGWSALLETGAPVAISRRESVSPTRFFFMQLWNNALLVGSDVGVLYEEGDGEWTRVSELTDSVVGLVQPSALEPSDQLAFVTNEGALARWRDRETEWIVPSRLKGFFLADYLTDGSLVAWKAEPGAGLFVLSDEGWQVVVEDLPTWPESGQVEGTEGREWELRATYGLAADDALYLTADNGEVGGVWTWSGRQWDRSPLRYPPPEPDEPIAPAPGPDAEPTPPAPLLGVEARRLETEPEAMRPIVDVEVAADGRSIAVASDQVWWLLDDGWLLLNTSVSGIRGVVIDSGESYVLVTDAGMKRCFRGTCDLTFGEGAPEASSIIDARRSAHGLHFVSLEGHEYTMVPGIAPSELERAPFPEELPAGSWSERHDALSLPDVDVHGRVEVAGSEFLLASDGRIFRRDQDAWLLQSEIADALGIFAREDALVVVAERGALGFADVPDSVRADD